MLERACYIIGALVLSACSSEDSTSHEAEDPPISAESRAKLQGILDEAVTEGLAPGVSVAIEVPGHALWSGTAGIANLETGEPLTVDKRFRAGSIMKSLVAAATLAEVESGTLRLDQSVTDLLPAALATRIPDADAITLKMLLNHTSGLAEFADEAFDAEVAADPQRIWTLDELVDRAVAKPALFTPGSSHAYSNADYILIGAILENLTGQPWRATVRERVLKRAHLDETSLPEEGNPRCGGCSRGYQAVDDELIDLTEIDPSMAGASGGHALVTTPADLARFLRALWSQELFDEPETLELMLDFALFGGIGAV